MINKEVLSRYAGDIGVQLDEKALELFDIYAGELVAWNEKMNLTAITEEEEVWEKHFYDSILPFASLNPRSMCDVGSGAGFPGIPVKIAFPECHMTLLEPLQKRCRFLNEVKETLGLKDVQIVNARAEDYVKEAREKFEVVSARAVARLSILLELCVPLLKPDGIMVALKGKNGEEELKNAQKAVHELGIRLIREEKTIIEDDSTRINFYFKKMRPTPKKYPRAYGQIKKKPLEDAVWEK
ncbi:MAG TPA: 16S rRNA (guanine(527)-N(7))-methyltransferase RsmG [Erysipelotrichaceae bacterium]|nr:16S rRNA (guanine(527)-N(7))-methyltransferase RsmG [Erysipelotrichaceae bacterium]